MKKTTVISLIVILIVIITAMLAVAAPALAKDSCGNDFDCLVAERVPDALASLEAALTPDPTETTTTTPDPTETLTATPEVTETPSPTQTELPGPTFTVDLWPTEFPNYDPHAPGGIPTTPSPEMSKRAMTCYRAWIKITESVNEQETGYRYFDKHTWCKTWLMREYAIDYDAYKALHPVQ